MIQGELEIVISPYHATYHDGTASTKKLIEDIEQLHKMLKPNGFKFGYKVMPCKEYLQGKSPEHDLPERKAVIIGVPYNTNFWFQITQLPLLLVPDFYKMPPDKLEEERQKLIANDAWGMELYKKLANQVVGLVMISESYDSFGCGNWKYGIWPMDDTTAEVSNYTEGNVELPNHPEALRKQIDAVKALAKASKLQDVKIRTDLYHGMFN